MICLLCRSSDLGLLLNHRIKSYGEWEQRTYWHCPICDLVQLNPEQQMDWVEEKSRYATHNNDSGDPRYQAYLDQMWNRLEPYLKPGDCGLDYGCGPEPALALWAQQRGWKMEHYDPHFFNHPERLKPSYDFVTCTEVVEHFRHPLENWQSLSQLLTSGSYLGVMTQWLDSWENFESWYYHRDPTHIAFYSDKVFYWIAQEFEWSILYMNSPVAIFQVK